MDLSAKFTLSEFLVSESAARHDIDMTAPPEVVENLKRLATEILQPLRDELTRRRGLDTPIVVTSGYRPPELNRLIGGSPNSQHQLGEAADIRAIGFGPADVFRAIERLDLPWQQLIFEFSSWVHVSVPSFGQLPARERFSAVRRDGATVYLNGLVA